MKYWHLSTDGCANLTVLVHKDFGQALASHQYREWISAIISLVDFPNLHCVICQEVMDDAGMVITKGTVGVIPYGIEAKHLEHRKKKGRQTWTTIIFWCCRNQTQRCLRVPHRSAPEEAGETQGEFSQSKGHLCLSEIVCSGTWHQYFGGGKEWMQQQDHS